MRLALVFYEHTFVSPSRERGLSLAIRAWLSAAGMVSIVWIPAFAGMTGCESGILALHSTRKSSRLRAFAPLRCFIRPLPSQGFPKILRSIIPSLNRDGKIVILASAARSFDYGFLSVFLGVYLEKLDFSVWQAGLVFSAIMAGGALSNAVASWRGDRIGRRRMLVGMAALMGIGGALFPLTEQTAFLIAVSLIAMTTSTGGDRTAFLSLDMAILAQSGDGGGRRTLVFSWYNLLGRLTKAASSLMLGLPALLVIAFGVDEILAFKMMFLIYALIAFAGCGIYGALSDAAEPPRRAPSDAGGESSESRASALGLGSAMPPESRSIVIKLSLLFSMDSFGGGFMVTAFMSYFFAENFGMSAETIGLIFFVAQLLNAVSIMLAAPTARRLGLIVTMAGSQGIANALMIFMALAENPLWAIAFFMARELINDMDIPTRQAYSMAIVPPEARTATAGVTNLGRTIAQTVAPLIAGPIAASAALGVPIIVGAVIKLVYNGALYAMFRTAREPDEEGG